MLEYNVTRDDFESDDDWAKFIYDLNTDVNSPYYGTANVTGSYALRPGYIMSFYQRGTMDALALQKMFSVIDPNNNLFPSLLEQNGLTDQYNSDVEFLSEVNRWLADLENFLRGDQAEDDDGRFRAIEAREWRELLEQFKDGEATVRQVRDFFENVSYLPELEGWNDYEQYILDTDPFNAPQTWEEVKRILKSNGYSDEEIADIEASVLTSEGGLQNSPELAGILSDLGYDDSEWWETAGEGEQTFEDYANEVGEGVANTAKGLYDELKDKITGCVGSPLDCIKQIGTAILDAGGIPEECVDMNDPFFCTENGPDEGGKACWKDCVNFNLPGLPIPDIPLPPGVVDVGTYRDFENAVKTVGKTIGDIIDGNASCGPNGDQECTVGQVLEDLGDWAREQWEDAIGGIDDATGQDVLDWLKGILGPAVAGIIWTEIEEEVNDVLLPVTEETKDCIDGEGQVYATVGVDEECPPVPCGEGEQDFGNGCEPICEYDTSIPASDPQCVRPLTETEEQCNAQGKVYDELNDVCKEECKNPEYVIGADGNCGPDEEEQTCNNGATNYPDCDECPSGQTLVDNQCQEDTGTQECNNGATNFPDCNQCPDGQTTPDQHENGDCNQPLIDDGPQPEGCEEVDCNGPRPNAASSFDAQRLHRLWNDCCGTTNCPEDGSLISDHPNNDCSIPIGTEACQDPNATNTGEYGPCQCPDGFTVSDDGKSCIADGVDCSEITDANYQECGKEKCEDGTFADVGQCPTGPQECAKPDGTPTGATLESNCEQCPDGYTFDFNGICQADSGTINCDDYNRTTNDDGTCGPCKEGYQVDTSLPNEPCVPIFDGCPLGYVLDQNLGECVPVTCPDGQAFCDDTGQCEDIGTCPSDPPTTQATNTFGGGSNAGGGGMMTGQLSGYMGDPQLLARTEFPITDFLTGLFEKSRGNVV